jgi:acyl carrier protein
MIIFNNIKLNNIDPEDLKDTLLKLEKSFGIKFADHSFKDAKAFGDICDIIGSQKK